MAEVWSYTKSFGFHVYLGSLIGVGMSQVSYILISYFSTANTGVGYFALALAFASPLKLIPNTIATTYYKDFSVLEKIPLKLTITTLALSATALIFLFLLIHPFVTYFYGIEFLPVIRLTYIAGLGMLFYGMADYFNRFLGARGKGILLRNSAFIVGIVILISNFLLIPEWAEKGAAIAYLISGGTYLTAMIYFYKRQIKTKS
jgi:O-antigen/teichoic acid export membrane protein